MTEQFVKILTNKKVFLTLFILAAVVSIRPITKGRKVLGWDTSVTCACLSAINDKVDPYIQKNLKPYTNVGLSCTYHVASYYSLTPHCLFNKMHRVFAILIPFLLFVLLLYKKFIPDRLFLLTTFFGFAGFSQYLYTGNILSSYEFLFLGLLFGFFSQKNFTMASVFFSALVFTKLSPAAYFPAYFLILFFKENKSEAFKQTAVMAAVFFSLMGLTYVLEPNFFMTHYKGLLGMIPGQHTVAVETGSGGSNSSYVLLIKDLFKSKQVLFWAFGIVTAVFGAWTLIRCAKSVKKIQNPTLLLALAFLTITVLMPRAKPYYYLALSIPLYYLLRDMRQRYIPILISCSFALLLFCFYGILTRDSNPILLILSNYQIVSVVLFLFYFSTQKLKEDSKV